MVWATIAKATKYLFRKPYTRMVPKSEPPFKTESMRGRHILDMNKCTGCSMCQIVCPANAIDMEVVEGDFPQNKRKRFPRIDLHKCTFCGLCVEYCPFAALSMTDITGFELYTKNKETTIAHPTDLAKPPKGVGFIVTITKEKFRNPSIAHGSEKFLKGVRARLMSELPKKGGDD